MEAYCVKCKTKREIQAPEATFTSTGTPATRGVCPVCGTGLYRMGRTEAHEGMEPPPEAQKRRKRERKVERQGRLVIVESPAKARTVGRFLGKDYRVKASIGHVRDLLRSQISVDVENDFQPKYRVPNEKREVVKALKADAARAEQIYLATDPDREGEAIAWHLLEAAEIDPELAHRVVFHEITKPAIEKAFGHPREIDMTLVDAQQARRILDRLVGYNISPILWSKVRSRLSAGRVQSAALRLIVDREREIEDFEPVEYWTLDAELIHPEKPPAFRAKLVKIDNEDPQLGSESEVQVVMQDMLLANYQVARVKRGTRTRRPSAPFTTSTLQQDASRRLNFSARKTMAIAQQLYEGVELDSDETTGLITYMRTDSTQVSVDAQKEAREVIAQRYGKQFLPDKAPEYKTRAKRAQEAHEAIRPTSTRRSPESLKKILSREQYRLYSLIWTRFIASQMKPAVYDTLSIEIDGASETKAYLLRVSASSLRFSGFLEAYQDQNGEVEEEDGAIALLDSLPDLVADDVLDLLELYPEQHFTQPPPRFSDASLVKSLEEYGIGRPSTYAPILTTLQRRGYIHHEKRRMHPTDIGMLVNDLVVEHFPDIVDLGFTARMEDELDEIAEGDREWVEVVRDFYVPFEKTVERAKELMPEVKAEPEELDRKCPESGHTLIVRHGRYGKFIGCSAFPECRYTEPWLEKIGVTCPKDGGDVVERRTRKGRLFYGCSNYPECDFTSWKKPIPVPCPHCGGTLVIQDRKMYACLKCENRYPQDQIEVPELEPETA